MHEAGGPSLPPRAAALQCAALCTQAQRRAERDAREEQKRMAAAMNYNSVMREEAMVTAREMGEKYASVEDYEDDFM